MFYILTLVLILFFLATAIRILKEYERGGEYQAANRLAEAAGIIRKYPEALQLRYLQTLREISSESNSTTLFPIPIDLFKPFIKK